MEMEKANGRYVSHTTGSEDDADTDVPVKLTVFGSKGTNDAMILGEDVKEKFRIGATDRFEVRD